MSGEEENIEFEVTIVGLVISIVPQNFFSLESIQGMVAISASVILLFFVLLRFLERKRGNYLLTRGDENFLILYLSSVILFLINIKIISSTEFPISYGVILSILLVSIFILVIHKNLNNKNPEKSYMPLADKGEEEDIFISILRKNVSDININLSNSEKIYVKYFPLINIILFFLKLFIIIFIYILFSYSYLLKKQIHLLSLILLISPIFIFESLKDLSGIGLHLLLILFVYYWFIVIYQIYRECSSTFHTKKGSGSISFVLFIGSYISYPILALSTGLFNQQYYFSSYNIILISLWSYTIIAYSYIYPIKSRVRDKYGSIQEFIEEHTTD